MKTSTELANMFMKNASLTVCPYVNLSQKQLAWLLSTLKQEGKKPNELSADPLFYFGDNKTNFRLSIHGTWTHLEKFFGKV